MANTEAIIQNHRENELARKGEAQFFPGESVGLHESDLSPLDLAKRLARSATEFDPDVTDGSRYEYPTLTQVTPAEAPSVETIPTSPQGLVLAYGENLAQMRAQKATFDLAA